MVEFLDVLEPLSRDFHLVVPAIPGVDVNFRPTPGDPAGLSEPDRARLEKSMRYAADRPGYQILHATEPQTVAYGLTDSPTGLLAWPAAWFTEWADPAAPISDDVIIADVMHHWLTGTAGSSARIVKESGRGGPCPVPLGVAVLPRDIVQAVRPVAERQYDIRRRTEFPRGGHFAALEVPRRRRRAGLHIAHGAVTWSSR